MAESSLTRSRRPSGARVDDAEARRRQRIAELEAELARLGATPKPAPQPWESVEGASNKRLQLVVRGSRGGVYDWPDTSAELVNMDDSMLELLGYEPQEVEQTVSWWRSVIHPDDLHLIDEGLERSMRTHTDFDVTYRIRFRDRGYRMVHSLAAVQPVGEHYSLTGMLLDVEEVQRDRLRLEAVNGQLERFSDLIAHDLGASLRHIDAFAEVIEEDFGERLGSEGLSHLKRIRKSSANGRRMIEDLYTYARTGTSELFLGAVSLGPLVEEIIASLSHDGAADHVTWHTGNLPSVRADPTQMRMLMQNLLSNAIKFTSNTEDAHVWVDCHDLDEAEVQIVVRDNGAGFEPKYANYIFEAFNRAHDKAEFKGTGIGLANVARIVTRHGGRISAEGAVGEGATFRLILPKA